MCDRIYICEWNASFFLEVSMFRKATVQDFDDVYALMCVLEETEFNKEEMLHIFQKQCADPHYYALVYDDGKHVKGVLNTSCIIAVRLQKS